MEVYKTAHIGNIMLKAFDKVLTSWSLIVLFSSHNYANRAVLNPRRGTIADNTLFSVERMKSEKGFGLVKSSQPVRYRSIDLILTSLVPELIISDTSRLVMAFTA